MASNRLPVSPAIRFLRAAGVTFSDHPYPWEEHGGTAASSRELGVDEHAVIKTLIMEDERRQPLIVLMHGDREVSTQKLARRLGVKSIVPCRPEVANRHSGYLVGGTSPFATRRAMPVYLERSVLELERIFINAGRRGYLVGIAPSVLVDLLHPELVEVAA
ncbi:MAG: Cys-tRNA(Pro)/Cys-tRNA(Cys) deacylase YbaK [Accumulibacter sp.]|uniref:aminoacyl-tRNA deacylase n=1 Tax=Accumulibacter sp. TaxID=2053492 RepID=UPI00122B537F|nr:aminoacyl-tRNA deacylase [Accumulibacter sp.]TLD45946.1 MAG: Cys-tRNA(Pro)/Cys-tRNA(Cys) deacylase YbaK [Accumulibacter sp.]